MNMFLVDNHAGLQLYTPKDQKLTKLTGPLGRNG